MRLENFSLPFRRKRLNPRLFIFIIFIIFVSSAYGSPPLFSRFSPRVLYIRPGDAVTLKCEASGNPLPEFQWIKLGAGYISSKNPNGAFRIDPVGSGDYGDYECVASNLFGSVVGPRVSLVRARLEIEAVGGGVPINVTRTSSKGSFVVVSLSLDLMVDSQPLPTVIWREYSVASPTTPRTVADNGGDRALGVGGNSLALLDLEQSDEGRMIRATISNPTLKVFKDTPFWKISLSPNSAAIVPPKIVIVPRDAAVPLGETARFDCVANAKPLNLLRYHWSKDGAPLNTDSKYDLTNPRILLVKSVSTADAGVYSCLAKILDQSITSETDSKSATLSVHLAPRILKDVIPQIVTEVFAGSRIELPCQADGAPTPTPVWYRDAATIPKSANATARIHFTPNNSLIIADAREGDAGVYQCIFHNVVGSASMHTALTVLSVEPAIQLMPKNNTVISGDSIVLDCNATGAPSPDKSWSKDGVQISQSDGASIDSKSGRLIIPRATFSHTGSYCCRAVNNLGSDIGCTHVRVAERTVIIGPPSNTSVIISTPVEFHCKVSHDPNVPIELEWLLNGQKIVLDDRRKKLADGTLKINYINYDDKGEYTCSVKSSNGNDARSAHLTVIELPFPPSGVSSKLSSTTSRNVIVTWTAPFFDGNSPIQAYLIQGQQVVFSDISTTVVPDNATTNPSLSPAAADSLIASASVWETLVSNVPPSPTEYELENLAPAVTYRFRVAALNKVGEGKASVASNPLTIPQEAPSEPPRTSASSASISTIRVAWQPPPPKGWNGVLRGYVVDYRLSGYHVINWQRKNVSDPAQSSYLITNLLVYKDYDVRVAAFNDKGVGVYSPTLIVRTLEGTPTQPPSSVSIVVVNSTSLLVSWIPPPRHTINGINQGYKVRAYRGEGETASCPIHCRGFGNIGVLAKEIVVLPNTKNDDSRHEGYISNLSKFTAYNVSVTCFTSAGDGVMSPFVAIVTDEDLPDVINNLNFPKVLDSSITVAWEHPISPNGVIINYTVYHSIYSSRLEERVILPPDRLQLIITGLKPETRYSISVTATTSVGEGPRRTSSVTSGEPPELPQPVTSLAVSEITATSVKLEFEPGSNGKTTISEWIVEGLVDESLSWQTIFSTSDVKIADRIIVPNLRPYTRYSLRIVKINVVGRSAPSGASRSFRTEQAPPSGSPENVILRAINATAIRVSWTPLPAQAWNGNPKGYKVRYENSKNRVVETKQLADPNLNTVVLKPLHKWTIYYVAMAAFNDFGSSDFVDSGQERTMEDVPSEGPVNVTAVNDPLVASAILVDWGELPPDSKNGQLQGFKILYSSSNGENVGEKDVVGEQSRSARLSSLLIFVEYEISVAAYTRMGVGAKSPAIRTLTGEDKPGPPYDVMFSKVDETSATIIWKPPLRPNGVILGYAIEYLLKSHFGTASANPLKSGDLSPETRYFVAYGLDPEQYYTFTIKAKTRHGYGEVLTVDVYTRPNRRLPDTPLRPSVNDGLTEARSVTLSLVVPDSEAPVRYHTIFYQTFRSGVARKRSEEEVGVWSDWAKYVPEKILPTGSSYTLKNLRPYTKYRFRVTATNDVGTSSFSPISEPILTLPSTPSEPPQDIRVVPVTSNAVEVSFFDPPKNSWSGPRLDGYIIQYRKLSSLSWQESVLSTRVSSETLVRHSVRIDHLVEGERYEFRILAYNSQGSGSFSPLTIVDVGVAVPSAPPKNLRAEAPSSTEINVTWTPPASRDLNGNLLGYKLYFIEENSKREGVKTTGYKNNFVLLSNMRKYTLYRLKILAFNSAGDGRNSSGDVLIKTLEDYPGPPSELGFHNLTLNSLKLRWNTPVDPNGVVLSYEIVYEEIQPIDGISRTTRVQKNFDDPLELDVVELTYLGTYGFRVRAKTSVGFGPSETAEVKVGPQPGSPGPVVDLNHEITSDALVLFWKYSEINNTVGYILEKRSRELAEESSPRLRKRADVPRWGPWELEVMDDSKITGYQLNWGKLKQGSQYYFRVVAYNYKGPSTPTETGPVRPLPAVARASTWWSEGWFKVVMAVCGFIILAILVATLVIVGRNRKRKEQTQMKRTGTMQRVEHVRAGQGHVNPVHVSDEILGGAGGGFATTGPNHSQRQSLRKSLRRAVNHGGNRQPSYREPPLPSPAANYSEEDDDEEDTSYSQRVKNERGTDDVMSNGAGSGSGSSELTTKEIEDSLSPEEDDDDEEADSALFPPPPAFAVSTDSVNGFSTLPQNYSQYTRPFPRTTLATTNASSSLNLPSPVSTFQRQQPPLENPYSAGFPRSSDDGVPVVNPAGRGHPLHHNLHPLHPHHPYLNIPHGYTPDESQLGRPGGQSSPRRSDSPNTGPPPYGVMAAERRYGGSQQGSSQFGSGLQFARGFDAVSSPTPSDSNSRRSAAPSSISPRGLASGAHFDSSSFVNHYNEANEELANGGSLRRQPKRRVPSHLGGESDHGSDISLTEVSGGGIGLYGSRISQSPSGRDPFVGSHQRLYFNNNNKNGNNGPGSRAPLPGFSSFV